MMMRKFLLAVGMGLALSGIGAAMAPTEASAGWRRGGFHGPRFHAVRIHRVHRPHLRWHRRVIHRHGYFPRHRFYRPRVRVVHVHRGYRPHYRHHRRIVHRHRYFPRRHFHGPRFVAVKAAYALGPSCVVRGKVRWNRWGERVRVVREICH